MVDVLKLSDFDYELPEELIAQTPSQKRDYSKMMVLHPETGEIEHKHFFDIVDYLDENCVLILNNTKVIPARLYGHKDTGAKIEIFLLKQKENKCSSHKFVISSGLISFLYLELIDASFSLDGVLGAFALSHDIIIITIGLAIGAMFVRSMTIMFVEEGTLDEFIYLEHGAHWAIGLLAILMFLSTVVVVPEVVTGLTGLGFIIASVISSKLNKESI